QHYRRARGRGRAEARRSRQGSRCGHLAGGAQTHLPPLLSNPGERRGANEGQRARALHRAIGREETRRPRVRREPRRGAWQDVHVDAAQGRRRGPMMPRVLIVEDEQHLADGLRFNLEAEGYEAAVVETGEAAIESLIGKPASPFDLVVLDVMLPGKDGFAVVS